MIKYREKLEQYYIDKLFIAWVKYGKIIICVDYDSTILPYIYLEDDLCETIILNIKAAKELGATLILYTCRSGDRLDSALTYCKSKGLYFDCVNPIIPFKPGYSHKPYCNIMLDDKAGLLSALEILQQAIKRYSTYKINNE